MMSLSLAKRVAAGLLVILFGGPGAAGAQAPKVEELVVTGERTGPGMWHVQRGRGQLWILGSLSPLPRGITWRSREVEHILGHTNQVLVQEPFEIGVTRILWTFLTRRDLFLIHGGKRLRDVLPPATYARFDRQRAQVTDDPRKWERYRPIMAAALLQREAFHKVNLSLRLDIGASLRLLARQHYVRLEEVDTARFGDMLAALKTLPDSTENTCLDASLTTLESGLPRLIERAGAWADGNVERLAALPEPPAVDACREALEQAQGAGAMIGRLRQTWLATLKKYLDNGSTTIAVINLDLVLEPGGLLEILRSEGYEVEGPTAAARQQSP
jgi:uncharacterized protein YbaP (TraB family)